MSLPADASALRWLELKFATGSAIKPDDFVLTRLAEQSHGITFSSRAGAPTPYFVRLDNCVQWRAMSGATVIFAHRHRQSALRLSLRA